MFIKKRHYSEKLGEFTLTEKDRKAWRRWTVENKISTYSVFIFFSLGIIFLVGVSFYAF